MRKPRHIGITGARGGASPIQLAMLQDILENAHKSLGYRYLHHGDCVGIDEAAHGLAKRIGYQTICHPPSSDKYRAHTEGHHFVHQPMYFLDRNKQIVSAVEVLLAFPADSVEVLRSGTWATIRHARRCGVTAMIVSADGLIRVEDNIK